MRLSCLLMMVALTALGSIGPGAGALAQSYGPRLFSQVRWRLERRLDHHQRRRASATKVCGWQRLSLSASARRPVEWKG